MAFLGTVFDEDSKNLAEMQAAAPRRKSINTSGASFL